LKTTNPALAATQLTVKVLLLHKNSFISSGKGAVITAD